MYDGVRVHVCMYVCTMRLCKHVSTSVTVCVWCAYTREQRLCTTLSGGRSIPRTRDVSFCVLSGFPPEWLHGRVQNTLLRRVGDT